MNKKGITIIEVLVSISLVSIIVLLLLNVILSLNKINNDDSYASQDEIDRSEIIKLIEDDFLALKLNGLTIEENKITFNYLDSTKKLIIFKDKIVYDNKEYPLESPKATYDSCFSYHYTQIDDNYYLITIDIPVLIDNVNTTKIDDLSLSYLALKNEFNNYPSNYTCSK